jgi:hypothetical protein
MAHYAFLDENNIVTEVITGVDENEIKIDVDGTEIGGSSEAWETWYSNFKGQVCKRTSYSTYHNVHKNNGTSFRGNYAGIGWKYDEKFDVFIPPQPYLGWKLDYTIFDWVPPVEEPEKIEGYVWQWSEINIEWIKVPTE